MTVKLEFNTSSDELDALLFVLSQTGNPAAFNNAVAYDQNTGHGVLFFDNVKSAESAKAEIDFRCEVSDVSVVDGLSETDQEIYEQVKNSVQEEQDWQVDLQEQQALFHDREAVGGPDYNC